MPLIHGQMHGNTHKHFLRRFELLMRKVTYRITAQQQVEPAVCKQMIALGNKESLNLVDLFFRVMLKDISTIVSLTREISEFIEECTDFKGFHLPTDIQFTLKT